MCKARLENCLLFSGGGEGERGGVQMSYRWAGEVTANLGDKYICLLHVLMLRKSEKIKEEFF